MSFQKELEKGNFVLGVCSKCKKKVWPPSEFCDKCFGTVEIKKGSLEGKIIEFSRQNDIYFCVAEFDQVKIIGKILSGTPKNNQLVKLEKCGIKDKNYFFIFSLIK